jgi:tetrahydromethanopterin S-methyltransferase subunit B
VTDGIAAATSDPAVLADPANKQILELFAKAQNGGNIGNSLDGDTSFLNGSDPRLSAPFLEGFNNATITIYWVGLAVVLVAFVLSFFLKAAPLRAKSALQENADDAAAVVAQEAADASGALVAPTFADSTAADAQLTAADDQDGVSSEKK